MYDELRDYRLVRSNCCELGRRFYEGRLGRLSLGEAVEAPARIPRRLRTFAGANEAVGALRRWLHLVERDGSRVDWRDLFYWEQRLAAWLADVEHSLDLNEAPSFQPLNGALFYTLLLLHADREGSLQRRIIESQRADLLELPVNPVLESRRRARRSRGARLLACLCHEALNTARLVRAIPP